jgi:hypothetical protein
MHRNAIQLKKLELKEKQYAAKVQKMEMDTEIQKAQLNMLTSMASMFASGLTGIVGGVCAVNHVGSELSMLLGGSTSPTSMTDSWVLLQ